MKYIKKNAKKYIVMIIIVISMLCGCGKNVTNNTINGKWVPKKDITIICGYGAGGSTDLFARIIAEQLEKRWNVNVIVKNVEGGSGTVGTTECYYSSADGYTVFISNGATITQSKLGEVEWNYDEFTNIAKVIDEDEILCVNGDSNITSLDDLIRLCNEKPGQISIGVAGVGGFTYLAAQRFIKEFELDVKIVAYNSGSEAVTAVMGGFVDFCIQQPAEVYSGISSGRLKGIAIMSEKRHNNEVLADIPTMIEQGYDFQTYQWRGISAPTNLPINVVEEWSAVIDEICSDEEFINKVDEILYARVNLLKLNDMSKFMDDENQWIKNVMKDLDMLE